jgi:hypothetical protein
MYFFFFAFALGTLAGFTATTSPFLIYILTTDSALSLLVVLVHR